MEHVSSYCHSYSPEIFMYEILFLYPMCAELELQDISVIYQTYDTNVIMFSGTSIGFYFSFSSISRN